MDTSLNRIELDSRLTELARAHEWIEGIADRIGLGEDDRFAINLCLEEALANIVLHGYRDESGHPISIQSSISPGSLSLTIDDHAPAFSPIELNSGDATEESQPLSLESIEPGGNGLRLLRKFAGSLSYERLSNGNRMILGFSIPR